jgi:hypothetical protein
MANTEGKPPDTSDQLPDGLDFKTMLGLVQGFEAASYFKLQDKQHHSGYRNIAVDRRLARRCGHENDVRNKMFLPPYSCLRQIRQGD